MAGENSVKTSTSGISAASESAHHRSGMAAASAK